MEYKSVDQLARVADVNPEVEMSPVMSPLQCLQRWAEVLERDPERRLQTLFETEYQRRQARQTMRADDTPIGVAFADPVLRVQGLADDTYGEAKRVFAISDRQLHNILCYCHHGSTMAAGTAAREIRRIVAARSRPGIVVRLRRLFAARIA